MNTNLRNLLVTAAMLALVLIFALGLLTSPRRLAVAEEPEPPADSPDQYIWTVVYRIATKPEGEAVAVPLGTPSQTKIAYTFVKEFQVRPDGTFAFDDCDFGFCRQEVVQEFNKAKIYTRTSWLGLLRGSGKWQPATGDADEKLTLKLEWGAGDGASETHTDGDANASVSKYAASPDGGTVTTTSEPSGGKPISYSYPNSFVASEWTLKPDKVAPNDSRGAFRGRGLKVIPVSFLAAAEDECDDKKDQKYQGNRPTTLICAAGPKTPVTETVEITKRKKEADLAVSLGGEEAHPQPGSTGTVEAVVSNNGPCEAHATLKIRLAAGGYLAGEAHGYVEVLMSDDFSSAKIYKSVSADEYFFTYQFTLPKGATRTVEITAKDRTPPGQTLPYTFTFFAEITGDLPDPNGGNNLDHRFLYFDPPK